jgi:hypothetical protein
MKIYYSDDRCGAGKTRHACRMMASQPGKWVYAIDRKDEVGARDRLIREFALAAGTQPVVMTTYSDGMIRVHQEIAGAPAKYAGLDHIVLMVMHEGLKASDLSGFVGWRIVIDEVPGIWDSAAVRTPSLHHQLSACYRLAEPKGGWSRVVMKPDAPSVADLARDDTMAPWALFHRRVKSRQGVYVSLKAWADSVDGREWKWFSLWSPLELEAFDQVYLLGNAFTHTITFKLLEQFYGDQIEFMPFSIGTPLTWARRKLTIRYFTDSHVAGTGFFATPEGKQCIRSWADWVRANSAHQRHYWTANEAQLTALGGFIPGDPCSSKIAGSNAFKDYHLCSILYTSKYNPKDDAALVQFGITPADILRSREFEDLIQIAFRSSLRMPASVADVEVRVYDQQQAEFLRDYLLSAGFELDIELVYTDIGINYIVRTRGGHPDPIAGMSEIEITQFVESKKKTQAQKAKERRDAKKAALIAAGEYRGRGRPRKEA